MRKKIFYTFTLFFLLFLCLPIMRVSANGDLNRGLSASENIMSAEEMPKELKDIISILRKVNKYSEASKEEKKLNISHK